MFIEINFSWLVLSPCFWELPGESALTSLISVVSCFLFFHFYGDREPIGISLREAWIKNEETCPLWGEVEPLKGSQSINAYLGYYWKNLCQNTALLFFTEGDHVRSHMCITTSSKYGSAGLCTELLADLLHKTVNKLVFHVIHNWSHISLDIKSLTWYHSTLPFFSKFIYLFYFHFLRQKAKEPRPKCL